MQVTKSITKKLEENNKNFGDLRVHIEDNKIIDFTLRQLSHYQAAEQGIIQDRNGIFIVGYPNSIEFLKYARNAIDTVLKEIGEE